MNAVKNKPAAAKTVAVSGPEPLTLIERAVFSCFTSKDNIDEIKRGIEPGAYRGDLALKINYTLTKAKATDAAPKVDILTPGIVARALIVSGLSQEKFMAALQQVAKEVLVQDVPASPKMASEMAKLISQFDRVKDAIAPLMERKDRSGSTRAVIDIGRLSSNEAVPMMRL